MEKTKASRGVTCEWTEHISSIVRRTRHNGNLFGTVFEIQLLTGEAAKGENRLTSSTVHHIHRLKAPRDRTGISKRSNLQETEWILFLGIHSVKKL